MLAVEMECAFDRSKVAEQRLITLRLWGMADGPAVRALLGEIEALTLELPGARILIDERDLDVSRLSTADVRAAADGWLASRGLRRSRVAIVAPKPDSFGLVRMFQQYAGADADAMTGIFRSLDEAMDWLST